MSIAAVLLQIPYCYYKKRPLCQNSSLRATTTVLLTCQDTDTIIIPVPEKVESQSKQF